MEAPVKSNVSADIRKRTIRIRSYRNVTRSAVVIKGLQHKHIPPLLLFTELPIFEPSPARIATLVSQVQELTISGRLLGLCHILGGEAGDVVISS